MSTLEELEERARLRAEGRAKAEAEQRLKDLTAKESLEEEYDGAIATAKVSRFKPGVPTMAIVRVPLPEHYKRFKDQVAKAAKSENAKSQLEAAELLAKASWVYPAPQTDGRMSDEQNAMLDAFPGILTTLGNLAAKLAEGSAAEEGKG